MKNQKNNFIEKDLKKNFENAENELRKNVYPTYFTPKYSMGEKAVNYLKKNAPNLYEEMKDKIIEIPETSFKISWRSLKIK